MDYKNRLLEEYRELVIKRTKLELNEFIQRDPLMQKQAEAMYNYEQILSEKILNIMHESDCVKADMKGVKYYE